MAYGPTAFAIVCCLSAATALAAGPASREPFPAQRLNLDALLAAYRGGDTRIVDLTFAESGDFQRKLGGNDPRELERWLGPWDAAKALLLLEIAKTATRVGTRYTAPVIVAGRRYLRNAQHDGPTTTDAAAFARLWHRTALGLLQGGSDPWRIDEHLADIEKSAGGRSATGPRDPRLALAGAIARERTCWADRPTLDHPAAEIDELSRAAGVKIDADLDGPRKGQIEARAARYKTCLGEALGLFDGTKANDETRAEASVRGGWVLFQLGRFQDAFDWLAGATPGDDRELAYWLGLIRGRVLTSLGRHQDALAAYQAAHTLFPQAQTGGIGFALALMRLGRDGEADEAARALRTKPTAARDPWSGYLEGDRRFVDVWLDQLRSAVR